MFSFANHLILLTSSLAATVFAAGEDVRIIFRHAPGYTALTTCQQACAAGTGTYSFLYSVVGEINCETRECVCNDPQTIADLLDECIVVWEQCYSLDTYNTVITFFGTECGFEPQLKNTITESAVYTETYYTLSTSSTSSQTTLATVTINDDGGLVETETSMTSAESSTTAPVSPAPTSSIPGSPGTVAPGSGPSSSDSLRPSGSSGLSPGDIGGIVVGTVGAVAGVIGAVALCRRKKRPTRA